MNYTTVDTIFASVSRLIGDDFNEFDVIEWAGDALAFMPVPSLLEESVAFLEVKDYTAPLPQYLKYIIQIGYNTNFIVSEKDNCTPLTIIENFKPEQPCIDCEPTPPQNCTDCTGGLIGDSNIVYYRPHFDLKWEYEGLYNSPYYKTNFIPVRLANNKLYQNLVCKTDYPDLQLNPNSIGELSYNVVGDTTGGALRFNFKEGQVAVAFLKTAIDWETGYPLIPDEVSVRIAIEYFIKWKMAEKLSWQGREGFRWEAQDNERKWLKYIRQATNKAKMPKGVDGYQNLLDQSLYLIPRANRYNNFFGKFSK